MYLNQNMEHHRLRSCTRNCSRRLLKFKVRKFCIDFNNKNIYLLIIKIISVEAMRALNMAWWFYMSKFMDMLDSVFFVLTKKFSHLSFLHVFHHGIMPFQTWWGARYRVGTRESAKIMCFYLTPISI